MGNNATTPFQTNAVGLGGTSGSYTASSGLYDFELLTAASTVTTVDASLQGLLTSAWSDTGASATSAGLAGRISSSASSALNWPAGNQQSFIIIGWSASMGGFSNVMADLSGASLVAANGGFYWSGVKNAAPGEYIGATTIQSAEAGGGASGLPPFALFGTTASGQGTPISTATELYAVSVPEPTTFALMGLAASSLLIFRRRK